MAIVCTEFCLYKTIFSDIDKNVKENGRNLILGRMSIKKKKKDFSHHEAGSSCIQEWWRNYFGRCVMLVYVNYVFSILFT